MYSSIRKFYYSHVNAPTHPQLVVLDAGIVSALEETQKRNFIDLFLALAQGDGYESGRLLIERAPQPAPPVRDPDGFCRKIEHLVDDNMENGEFILCKLKVSEVFACWMGYELDAGKNAILLHLPSRSTGHTFCDAVPLCDHSGRRWPTAGWSHEHGWTGTAHHSGGLARIWRCIGLFQGFIV